MNTIILNDALYESLPANPGPLGTIPNDPVNRTNQVRHPLVDPPFPGGQHNLDVGKYGEVSNPLGTPSTGHAWEETAPTGRSYENHDSLITYTLRLVNSSATPAPFARIRDYIPDGTEFVTASFGTTLSPTSERLSPGLSKLIFTPTKTIIPNG